MRTRSLLRLSNYIIPLLIIGSMTTARAQTSGNFACLVEVRQWCSPEQKGYIEFALKGDPANYTYYWTHGPTTLAIDCLPEGDYTFVVIDQFGCVETYTVTIFRIYGCTMSYELVPDVNNGCNVWIVITVEDNAGNEIPESGLNIDWEDGDPSGLRRLVSRDHTESYCVSISTNPTGEPGGEDCCDLYECIEVIENAKCNQENRLPVIVNELHRSQPAEEQFVELLVIGDAECPGSFDLRGFMVDDNNGYLIPGNDFISSVNAENIGIDPGYLIFADHPNWEYVPHGSLVLIHSGRTVDGGPIPADDPYDADQDGVYVLRAENDELLWAKSGTWNETERSYEYNGYLIPPVWETVSPSPNADGMQVRYPDGSFTHGISLGSSPFMDENEFSLWLTGSSNTVYHAQFTATDYLDKAHFSWSSTAESEMTPGLPNSVQNAAFIESMKGCPQMRNADSFSDETSLGAKETLRVLPNPFDDELRLNFHSLQSGEGTVRIHAVSGQTMLEEKISCLEGENVYLLKTSGTLPPGVLTLEFVFPSGEKTGMRIVRIEP